MLSQNLFTRWTGSHRSLPPNVPDPGPHEQICAAVRERSQVAAVFRGNVIGFCPHVVARGPRDEAYVLAFVFVGEPALAYVRAFSPKRWRWLAVSELGGVMLRKGLWLTGPPGSRPMLDSVRVEFEVPEAPTVAA